MFEAPKKLFLHVGCGPAMKENTTKECSKNDWEEIRFDIESSVSPDYLGTMTNMSAVTGGLVDAI